MSDPPPTNSTPPSSPPTPSTTRNENGDVSTPVSGSTTPHHGRFVMANPYKKKKTTNAAPQQGTPNPPRTIDSFVSPMPRASKTTPLPSTSTIAGRQSGIILYNEFATMESKPKFHELRPEHLKAPKFRMLSHDFVNWIANGNAKTKNGQLYNASTLAQYFSNWYNAVLNTKDEEMRLALATDSERHWHHNMTVALKKRLTNQNYNNGVNMLVNNTSCHRSTMVKLIQYLLRSGGTDSGRQRDMWEAW